MTCASIRGQKLGVSRIYDVSGIDGERSEEELEQIRLCECIERLGGGSVLDFDQLRETRELLERVELNESIIEMMNYDFGVVLCSGLSTGCSFAEFEAVCHLMYTMCNIPNGDFGRKFCSIDVHKRLIDMYLSTGELGLTADIRNPQLIITTRLLTCFLKDAPPEDRAFIAEKWIGTSTVYVHKIDNEFADDEISSTAVEFVITVAEETDMSQLTDPDYVLQAIRDTVTHLFRLFVPDTGFLDSKPELLARTLHVYHTLFSSYPSIREDLLEEDVLTAFCVCMEKEYPLQTEDFELNPLVQILNIFGVLFQSHGERISRFIETSFPYNILLNLCTHEDERMRVHALTVVEKLAKSRDRIGLFPRILSITRETANMTLPEILIASLSDTYDLRSTAVAIYSDLMFLPSPEELGALLVSDFSAEVIDFIIDSDDMKIIKEFTKAWEHGLSYIRKTRPDIHEAVLAWVHEHGHVIEFLQELEDAEIDQYVASIIAE